MKKIYFLPLFLSLFSFAIPVAQVTYVDSLKRSVSEAKEDTTAVNLYAAISLYYNYKYPDTVLQYAYHGLTLARKLRYKKGEINLLSIIGEALNTKGQLPKALEVKLQALQLAENLKDLYLISSCYNYLGALYIRTEDYQKARSYYIAATRNKVYFDKNKKFILSGIGRSYFYQNKMDSAYHYIKQAYDLDIEDKTHWTVPYYFMAAIYTIEGKADKALDFYRAGNKVVLPGALDILNGYTGMAQAFKKLGHYDSAIYYAKKAVDEGMKRPLFDAAIKASSLLTEIYKSYHKLDSAFKYQEMLLVAKDSLFSQDKVKLVVNLSFNEQQRLQQVEQARQEIRQQFKTQVKLYSLLAGLAVSLLIAFILYRNNRHKQQINDLLKQQKEEIQEQRDNLEKTLSELRVTQAQLIQSEKMASLGELTAGIAHEIQNPLNFVNNFSEVNAEMISEMKKELRSGNTQEAISIADDIEENEQKIAHHGKRADSIVKGMLQHSRAGSGKKEPTDINALADEYLRLSFHGFRAKDKSFNAAIETEFDESIGKIEVIPQDIGRVLLNLFNNAFYAVNEKKRQQDGTFKPTVSVSTKRVFDKVEIIIKDNGFGIPQKVVDKIFQPFYTTKPTGQGTGLGLSLSYDIIKAHGGELKVETKEGEGAEFIVELPVQSL